ncbi:g12169 [Coccomyxa viridis]|uniref:G12169 protein n=1 Tax=Coccomyxa viridis TaxID=1274662 RepID=A0ABP1GCB6_9CHLO
MSTHFLQRQHSRSSRHFACSLAALQAGALTGLCWRSTQDMIGFGGRQKPDKGRRICHAEADAGQPHGNAASSLSTVCDVLVLLKAADNVTASEAEEMVSNIWSAQYILPGVLCAFAGPESPGSAVSGSLPAATFTHGCRFRCGDRQKGEAFLASPAVQAPLSSEQGKRCSAQSIYIVAGQVPADLEAIFCRGIEWDCGVEHVLLLQAREGVQDEQLEEQLSQLAALAESSLAGAIQCTHGPATLSSRQGGVEKFEVTHAMLTRFETVKQLQAFLRLPPCSQLLKTSEDPFFASAISFTYDIAPPSGARSTAPQSHLL